MEPINRKGIKIGVALLAAALLLLPVISASAETAQPTPERQGAATGELLTQEERAYAAAYGEVYVIGSAADMPVEFKSNGSYVGAMPVLFERLAVTTGLQFTYLPDADDDRLQLAENGQAEIVSSVTDSAQALARHGMRRGEPIFVCDGKTYCLAYTALAPAELTALLEKAIAAISAEERTQIALEAAKRIKQMRMETPIRIVQVLLCALILFEIGRCVAAIRKDKKRRNAYLLKDPGTGLGNEAFFTAAYTAAEEAKQIPLCAVACMELDTAYVHRYYGDAAIEQSVCGLVKAIEGLQKDILFAAHMDRRDYALCFSAADAQEADARMRLILDGMDQGVREASSVEEPVLCAGVCLCGSGAGGMAEVLAAARIARGVAKKENRRFVQSSPEMLRQAEMERRIARETIQSLRMEEFVMYAMPLVCAKTDEISGVQALVRWQHPARGLLMPAQFLPQLQQTGQMNRLNQWVVESVCKWHQARRAQGKPPLLVSCNIGCADLRNDAFTAHVEKCMETYGIGHGQIGLELQPERIPDGDKLIRSRIAQLKRAGVVVIMDNFGGDSTSFPALMEYQPDQIKLDRHLLQNMRDKRNLVILHELIRMGHNLGITVVCEGVETDVENHTLRKLGCDQISGYLLYQPMPLDELDKLT